MILLLSRSNIHALAHTIGDARPGLVVGAFVLALAVIAVTALRWGVFLRSLGLPLPPGTLLRMAFVGTFFNAFLPTGIGGDAYKALRFRQSGSLAPAFASVLLDRLAGMVGLAVIGLSGAGLRLAAGDDDRVLRVAVALGLVVLGATALIVTLGDRFAQRWKDSPRRSIRARVGRTLSLISQAGQQRETALAGFGGGVTAQAMTLAALVLLARSLRMDVPASALAAIVLIATLAATIPLSVNGLGFREGALVWGLGSYGISSDQALAFALLALGMLLASSAVGGIVFVVAGGDLQRKRVEPSQDAR